MAHSSASAERITLQTIAAGGSAVASTTIVPLSTAYGIQAIVSGSGSVGATVVIQVSTDKTNWETLDTLTLSGTTTASAATSGVIPWLYCRSNCTNITGTSAALTVYLVQ